MKLHWIWDGCPFYYRKLAIINIYTLQFSRTQKDQIGHERTHHIRGLLQWIILPSLICYVVKQHLSWQFFFYKGSNASTLFHFTARLFATRISNINVLATWIWEQETIIFYFVVTLRRSTTPNTATATFSTPTGTRRRHRECNSGRGRGTVNRACKSRARKRGWGQEVHILHVNK